MENLTFVCLNCQKSFRLCGGLIRPVCPFCAANLYRVNYVPPRNKPKEWAALRRQIFCMETSLEREKIARTTELMLREHKLEQQGRGRTSHKLKKATRKVHRHSKKLKSSFKEYL